MARCLAARICSERRTPDELARIDAFVSLFEREDNFDRHSLIGQLLNDRYETSGDYPALEVARRSGWNAAMDHCLALHQHDRGLTELRRQTAWLDADKAIDQRFDDSDSDAPRGA